MDYNTIIIGAGAAGMFCGIEASRFNAKTLIVDHAKKPGEKIRISGGGRCNFTNLRTSPKNFLSQNSHFAKSALSRYTQHDFVDLVERYGIAYHEKALGQLFCDGSSQQIIDMLIQELSHQNCKIELDTQVNNVSKLDNGFAVTLEKFGKPSTFTCNNFVVATGGKSIPKMGATGLGYKIAEQFGLGIIETRPGLVPLTFGEEFKQETKPLAGVSAPAKVSCGDASFEEDMLFTHRGLSGPSILQISSFWREGGDIQLHFIPEIDIAQEFKNARSSHGKQKPTSFLSSFLPKAISQYLLGKYEKNIADFSDTKLEDLIQNITTHTVKPSGSEGYRTAEVTLGGVNTNDLSSKTMEAKNINGLYFIGEVVDVTGWLGGYNFQWAWSSAWAAGTAIANKG